MLETAWSRAIGIQTPVVNAPMGGAAGGRLAAAVSRAGGLGMIGMGSASSAAHLKAELRHVTELEQPFGIGLIDWVMRSDPDLLSTAIAAQPALLCISFGHDLSWTQQAHDSGIATATQIATARQGEQAAAEGVDVIVARGREGGGHGQPAVATLPLLTTILDQVDVPVLAAGGIASARGLAAVLAAGAAGAWIGTLFAACPEALTSEHARQALFAAAETDTVITSLFDRAQRYPWPTQFPERVVRNPLLDQWSKHRDDVMNDRTAEKGLREAFGAADSSLAPVDAGEGVGLIDAARSASDVIADLRAEALTLLTRWSSSATVLEAHPNTD